MSLCCSGCHRVIILTLSLWYQQAERVHELNEEIGKLLARAEQLGGEGNVEEAQEVLEKVEKTRAMKKEAEVSWQGSRMVVVTTNRRSKELYCD